MSTAAAAAAMLDQQQQHQRRCLPLSSSSSPPPRTTSTPLPPPLPETALLRGALCALQGADSDVLRFCKERDAFVLTCEAALATPRAAASLVLQLAEVGWLHRRVRRAAGTCCTNGENSSSSSSSSGCSDGAVARAFRAALRGELAPVLEAAARLDDALRATTAKGGKGARPTVASVAAAAAAASDEEEDPLSSLLPSSASSHFGLSAAADDEEEETENGNYLTLRRAAALVLPLRERLLSLALAAEVAEAAPPHALPLCLAALADREPPSQQPPLDSSSSGSSGSSSLALSSSSPASRLSAAAAAPALAALWSWALDGALPGGGSESGEGFVRGDCAVRAAAALAPSPSSSCSSSRWNSSSSLSSSSKLQGGALWRHAFVLDAEAVPPCLWEQEGGCGGGGIGGGGGGRAAALASAAVAAASGAAGAHRHARRREVDRPRRRGGPQVPEPNRAVHARGHERVVARAQRQRAEPGGVALEVPQVGVGVQVEVARGVEVESPLVRRGGCCRKTVPAAPAVRSTPQRLFIRGVQHRRGRVRGGDQRDAVPRARDRRLQIPRRRVDDAEAVVLVRGGEEERGGAVEAEGVDAGGRVGLF